MTILLALIIIAFAVMRARSSTRQHRRDMQDLINAVKPAIRHNRSQPAIERAAEAIRIFEEANR